MYHLFQKISKMTPSYMWIGFLSLTAVSYVVALDVVGSEESSNTTSLSARNGKGMINFFQTKNYILNRKQASFILMINLLTSSLIRPSYTIKATIFEKVFQPEKFPKTEYLTHTVP